MIGSELIRHAAERTAQRKPIVVSMSGYAASGGYWVWTRPRTSSRSRSRRPDRSASLAAFDSGTASQKIYIHSGAITRGANVEMFDEFTDFTPGQLKIFQDQLLGDTYQKFLKVVADGRHMTVDNVNTIAQGRVWTGQQAEQNKLVDKLDFPTRLPKQKRWPSCPSDREVALIELPEQPGLLYAAS